MTDEVRELSRRRAATDTVAVVLGLAAVGAYGVLGNRGALVLGAYGLLLGTSTGVVTYCLTRLTGIYVGGNEAGESGGAEENGAGLVERAMQLFTGRALEDDADVEEDTGWLIGRLENVLVLTLVLVGEYTALSIVFAAKSWVRREDTASENSTYYLAGTLTNFTYSIVAGLATLWLLGEGF